MTGRRPHAQEDEPDRCHRPRLPAGSEGLRPQSDHPGMGGGAVIVGREELCPPFAPIGFQIHYQRLTGDTGSRHHLEYSPPAVALGILFQIGSAYGEQIPRRIQNADPP
jgi:hypothetical protein